MDDWKERVKEVLMSFDKPIHIPDLCRIVGLSVDDMEEMYPEIVRISRELTGTPYALVIEEQDCMNCYAPSRFTGKMKMTCERCGGFVPPPKVCINPR